MSIETSNKTKLKKRIIIKLIVFIVLCIVTTIVSYWQPESWTKYYGGAASFLTRLWILTALVTTAILTYSTNCETIGKALSHYSLEGERHAEITTATMRCSHLNHIIGLLILALWILVGWKSSPLFLVILLVGPMLVGIIMIFDYNVSELHKILLAETKQLISKTADADKKRKYQENEIDDKNNYEQTKEVVWKLDFPILLGVLATFLIGMLVFPGGSENIRVDDPYVIGFASGSTALQLLVGNISFSVMGLLSCH